MRKLRSTFIAVLFLSPGMLRAADPFLGKWNLDIKRSKYPAPYCPARMTIEMTSAPNGVHYHSETHLANGASFSADYVAHYDDHPTMVAGAKGVLLPVSLHRESSNVVIARYVSGLETRATSRRIVSADGNTMTVTTTSRDGSGNEFTNVGVYKKANSSSTGEFDLSRTKTDRLVPK
ncbi:hypothetical protein [Terriglobus saanensis]|uniref:Lipocalin-like domain-containing protein n=1 Tax=Terriglobus saanensis (strain ATCC BAA-1853 / DSM 23119 / SP1PR4) TaxID=401053 RepID=E8V3J2_TERSS|nr:hypothetical protein [Terriglobus saanensis]ADV83605.1 hypothetical protein AciPR4_2835 [Terriglobus saanensis SP1PR4]